MIGVFATAFAGAYALLRRTKRQEDAADKKQSIDDNTSMAAFWQKQLENQRRSDIEYHQKVDAQVAELYKGYKELEDKHLECREEHATQRGEIVVLRKQIAELESRLKGAS